ncbi:MAG: sigma-70 family RNA polymerase sigma factor [candidate division Zixibacteria bacterium]|nr:sigma-70 family RNA polymerase sigma factor [candidate division Zixibacteria bacterium]
MNEGNQHKKHLMPDEAKRTDEALLKLISERDEKALELFYEYHNRLVYNLIRRMLGDSQDAEEVTQEVFMKVWDNADKFDGRRGNVQGWLVTMTRRLAIDRTRSKQYKIRNKEGSLDSGVNPDSIKGLTGKANETAEATEVREVAEALKKIDDSHSEALYLSYYEGYSHSEIAENLNIPLGTVKHRIREAVNKLRKILDIG